MAKYDIHFQIVPEGEQAVSAGRVFSFGYVSALGVRGPQKLVNRWLKCFFTPRGSDPILTQYGTGFADLIGSNVSRYQDFVDAVTLFVKDCNTQLTAIDRVSTIPDDERLESAVITSVVPRGADGYDVYITIKNIAGGTITVQVPTGAQ
jgi:hypothetical protein